MKSAYVIAPLFLLMAGCSQNARTDQAAENTGHYILTLNSPIA